MSGDEHLESSADVEATAVEAERRVALDVLLPLAQHTDRAAEFPRRQLAALAELGVMGMNLPTQWGGPGLSAPALAACVEVIAAACGSTASALTAHFLATDALLLGGDADLKARYLPAAKRGRGERYSLEASMAKLHASEVAGRVADQALQLHGGYGFTSALPLERYVRDLRIMRIYEGSSEIQRTIIARGLTGAR